MSLRLRPTRRAAYASLAVLLAAASGVTAQACIGTSSVGGQGPIIGSAAFTDGAWAPGGAIGYDTNGPVTILGDFSVSLADNSDLALGSGGAAFVAEVPNLGFSICPFASASYLWVLNDGGFAISGDAFSFAGGLAVGGRIQSTPDFAFIPSLTAGVVHVRASGTVGGLSGTDTATHGSFNGALTLAFGNVFVGPAVGITTADGADPVFTGRIGVAF
jgi:hypothetical protein